MVVLGTTTADIADAAHRLRNGELVSFPTETVYGLGADAANELALARIFQAKGRPADHPLIVHLGDALQIKDWARDIPDTAWQLARTFWPGPLTLILQRAPHVSDRVTGGQNTIGLRVPDHAVALALLREFGGGIAAPSANRFGRVSPTLAEHVIAELGAAVDAVIDGGPTPVGLESTILDLSTTPPRILRPGAITTADLTVVLGDLSTSEATTAKPRVPGSLSAHYAPATPLQLAATPLSNEEILRFCAASRQCAVMSLQAPPSTLPRHCHWIKMPDQADEYARALYAQLHLIDRGHRGSTLIELPPDTPAWEAARDRLHRAAAGSVARGGAPDCATPD